MELGSYAESHAESHPMFSLKSKNALLEPIHKIDSIKYSPSSLAAINNNNSNNFSQFTKRRCIYMFATLIHKCRIRST